MKARPLISFVIPFYNRFALLKEAVRSVLSSDFSDLEIILADDASDGDALGELSGIMNGRSNILYIRQPENRGPGAARNKGVRAAKGEWVFFMDSDDVIYGDALPELAAFLAKERDSDIIVLSEARYKFPDGRAETRRYAGGSGKDAIDEITDNFRNGAFGGTLWNFCYKRSFLEACNILFPETYTSDDETFSTSACFYAKKIVFFKGCLYEYRLYSDLSINSQIEQFDCKSEKIFKGRSEYFNRLLELYESDLPDGRKRYVENFIFEYILCSLWEPERYKNNTMVKRCLDKFHDTLARFSESWRRELYIAPCFMGAVNAANLITGWGASVTGFVDREPAAPRAMSCKKESGLDVFTIDEVLAGGKRGGIVLFSKHSGAIERGFISLNLVADKDYLKTGLL
jgi:glycosyltransferase involved in cell wall biosynthesis